MTLSLVNAVPFVSREHC